MNPTFLQFEPRISEAAAAFVELAVVLRARRQTLCLAESCTGGLVSAVVASLAGVSDVYKGSVVAYANQVKQDFLGVRSAHIAVHGAVSSTVAIAMAKGARKNFAASWAVSLTGVAGPSGGSPEKPVGTVWIAVCGPGVVEAERYFFSGERTEIQAASTLQAIQMLKRFVSAD